MVHGIEIYWHVARCHLDQISILQSQPRELIWKSVIAAMSLHIWKLYKSCQLICLWNTTSLYYLRIVVLCSTVVLYPLPVVPTYWTSDVCPQMSCSEGGELLATGQLSNSSPNHHHTHPTHIQTSKLCLPLYSFVNQTKDLLFNKFHRCLGTCPTSAPGALPIIL